MTTRLLGHIATDFPALRVERAELATNGWDHDVAIVNDDYVFRFSDDPLSTMAVEVAVLDHLRDPSRRFNR